MNRILEWFQRELGISPTMTGKIIATIMTLLALWALRKVVMTVIIRRTADTKIWYQWKKTTLYVAVTLGIFIIGRTWFEGFGAVATYLGLVSAGLAVALKDPITNFAGWLFIIWRRPFEVGDRVQLGDTAGDVIDQRVFQFTILEIGNWVNADQSTGRIIHVPNGKIFTEPQANYTKGFLYIWNEIPVLVTFESDWQLAKKLLSEIINRHAEHLSKSAESSLRDAARRYMIFYSNLTPIVYTSVEDSGVMLTIRYLCDPRNRRGSAEKIWEDILQTFAKRSNIDFAYPTQRFFNTRAEGKFGTPPVEGGEVRSQRL